jgi:hypothetical protein
VHIDDVGRVKIEDVGRAKIDDVGRVKVEDAGNLNNHSSQGGAWATSSMHARHAKGGRQHDMPNRLVFEH